MADDQSVAAGKRFAKDMKRIREERGLSVDDLHSETRIARSLIESFEDGGLYDHSTFNEVYLRSFVRAYAEAVDIDPGTALDGLDAALDGTYDDALAQQHLHAPPPGDDEDPPSASEHEPSRDSPRSDAPIAGGPEGRGGLVGPPRALGEDDPAADADAQESGAEETAAEEAGADEAGTEPVDEDTSAPDGVEDAAHAEDVGHADDPEADDARSASERGEADSPAPPSSTDAASSKDDPPADAATGAAAEDEHPPSGAADDDLDVRPSWMEEQDDTEAEEDVPATPPPDGPETEQAPSLPSEEIGGTGIVGEPTAMGEETPAAPEEPARPSAPRPPTNRATSRSTWARLLGGEQQEVLWVGVGIAVILLVLVGLGVAFFASGDAPAEKAATPATTVSDTAAAAPAPDTTDARPSPPPANVELGPAIPLTVLATDNVSGIRIRRDDDLRRPYWIGEGTAQVFPFQQEVTVEDELDDVDLFLAGFPYPVPPQDTADGLTITRAQARAFVDTLRGAPATLSVPVDTIPVGAPEQ